MDYINHGHSVCEIKLKHILRKLWHLVTCSCKTSRKEIHKSGTRTSVQFGTFPWLGFVEKAHLTQSAYITVNNINGMVLGRKTD